MRKAKRLELAKIKVASESLNDQLEDVYDAFEEQCQPAPSPMAMPEQAMPMPSGRVEVVYDDHVIACFGDEHYSIPYTADAATDEITFADQSQWQKVAKAPDEWIPIIDKTGEKSMKAVTKSEADGEHPASHYLVVEDPKSPSSWHLRVKGVDGKPDHGLMGAAWAALHDGYRGNVYEGPGKSDAIAKLKKLYAAEGMDTPDQGKSLTAGDETKIGRRNNAGDAKRLQMIHDYSVENGAICKQGKALELDEVLVASGSQVKALGGGRIGGYLVLFGDREHTDLTGEYFTPDTDFGDAQKTAVLFQHGFDAKIGRRKLGSAELRKDDVGVWMEGILEQRDEYEKMLYALAEAGKMGLSSGTASHLVEKSVDGQILSWPLGLDASLTHVPAEPRTQVLTLKSWTTSQMSMAQGDDKNSGAAAPKETDMNDAEVKAMLEAQHKATIEAATSAATEAAKAAVGEVLEKLPEVKAKLGAQIEVVVDEGDRPFKNVGEQLIAVAKASRGILHPRLKALQALEIKAALGSNEAVPSQGEILLEPTITQSLLTPIHDAGAFSQDITMLPVNPNSNSGWIPGVDETSRATGSRWGGVRGYHTSEAGSMTASKPKFRKVNWELHKLYVLQYATDELLNDAAQLAAIIQKSSSEELNFMVNDDILNGIGGDRAVGVMNSSALISVTRVDASKIQHADIVAMWARLHPRSKATAKWYINTECHPQLDALTFTSGSTGILSPYVRYDSNGVMNIYGRPVVETEFNAALGTVGDVVLADMKEYLGWEKNAIEAASSIHVQFITDETAFRFIYRFDGQTALASALTPYKGSSTLSPFVALSTSS